MTSHLIFDHTKWYSKNWFSNNYFVCPKKAKTLGYDVTVQQVEGKNRTFPANTSFNVLGETPAHFLGENSTAVYGYFLIRKSDCTVISGG